MTLGGYLRAAFRWQRGRQGSGYDKMLLLTARWPLPFDSYLIRYPEGSAIPPHADPVQAGRHYRLNIVLKASPRGGEFVCATPIWQSRRIKFFRPDTCEHSVTRVEGGSRYVLSVGWVLKDHPHAIQHGPE
ncbi:2OG-Fe(II) oxygenase [Roseateles sp. DXS20W]|uniref:2OG-Fe(II) oxygenase n=1 Tax=Pelomonas lactea TaxID=3299030 RepID=A0ABW7GI93_9BURK